MIYLEIHRIIQERLTIVPVLIKLSDHRTL